MKFILAITILFGFSSCNSLSEKEKEKISFYIINIHNSNVKLNFVMDSINSDTELRIRHIKMKDRPELIQYLNSHGQVFENDWNKPYSISKDYKLTIEKYLEYCKANNKDPKVFYKFMD